MNVHDDLSPKPILPVTQTPLKINNKDDSLHHLKVEIPSSSQLDSQSEPIKGKLLNLSSLDVKKAELIEQFKTVKALDSTQPHSFQEISYIIAQKQVEKILNQAKLQTHEKFTKTLKEDPEIINVNDKGDHFFELGATVTDFIPEYQLDPSVLNIGEKMEPLVIEEAFARYFPDLEISVVGVNILSRGCITFASGMILNQIDGIIKAKEKSLELVDGNRKDVLQKEIAVLKKWLEIQQELFNNLLTESLIMSVTSLPKAGSAVGAVVESGLLAVKESALAAGNAALVSAGTAALGSLASVVLVVDAIGAGATILRTSLALRDAREDVDNHKAWSHFFVQNASSSQAKLVYEKQKKIFLEKCELNQPLLNNIISSVNFFLEGSKAASAEKQVEIVAGLQKNLLDQGIEIPLENPTLEELQAYLTDNNNYKALNQMMVTKKEDNAARVGVRNALKTLANKKAKIDEGFLSLALTKASAIFSTAVIVTTAVIVLKILILAGVIAASAAMSATGFGVLAVIIGFMIVGSMYLYLKKPNMFKTYIEGVQARLFFWKIPMAVQNYRLNYSVLETKKISEQINELGLKVLEIENLLAKGNDEQIKEYTKKYFKNLREVIPGYEGPKSIDKQRKILRKYQSELKVIKESKEKQVEEIKNQTIKLKGSVEYFEKEVTTLQNRIDIAGWKDFQKELKANEATQPQSTALEEDYEVLARFLLKDQSFMEDPEIRNLFLHMGFDKIDWQQKDQKALKEEVSKLIRSFFAMETEDTIRLINKRNLLTKHGLGSTKVE